MLQDTPEFEHIPHLLRVNWEKYSDSLATYELLNDMTRVHKARLMNQSNWKTESEKERFAYAHDEYETHLINVKTARSESLKLKSYITSLEALFELYRSKNAMTRAEMNLK